MQADAILLWGMFLLCFARIVGFFVQAPIWGSNHMPKQALVGAGACIAVVVFPSLPVPGALPSNLFELGIMLMGQLAVGLVIGYVSFLVLAGAQFAGEILDIQMGLSVAASFDPASHGAVNLIRRFKFYFTMIIYLMLNGHHTLLMALKRSFEVIPLTGFEFPKSLIYNLIDMTTQVFIIGIQIAAPALAALFITQVALGLLARVAPQMNVFMLSFPLNIMIGMVMILVALPLVYKGLDSYFNTNLNQILQSIKMMMPGR